MLMYFLFLFLCMKSFEYIMDEKSDYIMVRVFH
ncbi:Uncharacterised protein [Yersinia kristensenii]|nr:Uncharacterised protein [Yersinia kristensenii]CNK41222.1 Uncharacterised protein [Yersinia kristensenii]